jgi:hypothetical protein
MVKWAIAQVIKMSIAASEMRILADGPETENGDFLTSDPL